MQQSVYRTIRALIAGAMVMANLFFHDESVATQSGHQHQDRHTNLPEKNSPSGKLLPADGVSVKILSPTKDQIFLKDQFPLSLDSSKENGVIMCMRT